MLAVKSRPCRGAENEGTVSKRFRQGGDPSAGFQDIGGPAGHLAGFQRIESPRAGYHQIGESHVGHGSADGTNVAAVDRTAEHDADVGQGIHLRLTVGFQGEIV